MSKTQKILIEAASVKELRQFAELELGIELPQTTNRSQIIAKIKRAKPDLTEVPAILEAEPAPLTKSVAAEAQQEAKKVRVRISPQDGVGGERPVFVSVNGRGMLIPRSEIVEIPPAYAEALANATYTVYDEVKNGEGEVAYVPRDVARFNAQFFEAPAQAQVNA